MTCDNRRVTVLGGCTAAVGVVASRKLGRQNKVLFSMNTDFSSRPR